MFVGVIAINTLELGFFDCALVVCVIIFIQWSLAKVFSKLILARCAGCSGFCAVKTRPRRIYECEKCGQKWYTLERDGDDGGSLGC